MYTYMQFKPTPNCIDNAKILSYAVCKERRGGENHTSAWKSSLYWSCRLLGFHLMVADRVDTAWRTHTKNAARCPKYAFMCTLAPCCRGQCWNVSYRLEAETCGRKNMHLHENRFVTMSCSACLWEQLVTLALTGPEWSSIWSRTCLLVSSWGRLWATTWGHTSKLVKKRSWKKMGADMQCVRLQPLFPVKVLWLSLLYCKKVKHAPRAQAS